MVDNFRLTVDSNTEIEPLETVRDVRMKGQSLVDNRVATIPQMTGATSSSNGSAGVVPTPSVGDREKYLKGDGTWAEVSASGSNVQVTQVLSEGTKIATISVDDVPTDLYAPEGGGTITDVVDGDGTSLVDENGVAHVLGEVTDVIDMNGNTFVDSNNIAVLPINRESTVATPMIDYSRTTDVEESKFWKLTDVTYTWTAPCDCVLVPIRNSSIDYIEYEIEGFTLYTTWNSDSYSAMYASAVFYQWIPLAEGTEISIKFTHQLASGNDARFRYIPFKRTNTNLESYAQPFLDYTGIRTISYATTDAGYTAPADGVLIPYFQYSNTRPLYCRINDDSMHEFYVAATGSMVPGNTIRLSEGDVVRVYNGYDVTGSAYFIPFKRVTDPEQVYSPIPDYANTTEYTENTLPSTMSAGFLFNDNRHVINLAPTTLVLNTATTSLVLQTNNYVISTLESDFRYSGVSFYPLGGTETLSSYNSAAQSGETLEGSFVYMPYAAQGVKRVLYSVTDVLDKDNNSLVDTNGVAHIENGSVEDVLFEGTSVVNEDGVADIMLPRKITTSPLLDYDNMSVISGSSNWRDGQPHEWTAPCDCAFIVRDNRGDNGNTFYRAIIDGFIYKGVNNNNRQNADYPCPLYSSLIPMKKGQTIIIQLLGIIDSSTTNRGYYIPYKTVDKEAESFAQPYLDYDNIETILTNQTFNASYTYTATKEGLLVASRTSSGSQVRLSFTVNNDAVFYGDPYYDGFFDCGIPVSVGDTVEIVRILSGGSSYIYNNLYLIPFKRTGNINKLISPIPDYANATTYAYNQIPSKIGKPGWFFVGVNLQYSSVRTYYATYLGGEKEIGFYPTCKTINSTAYWRDVSHIMSGTETLEASYVDSDVVLSFVPFAEFQPDSVSDVKYNGETIVDVHGVANLPPIVTDVQYQGRSLVTDGVAQVTGRVGDVQIDGVSILDEDGIANINTEVTSATAPTLDYANAGYISDTATWTSRNQYYEWTAPFDCVIMNGYADSQYTIFKIGDLTYETIKNVPSTNYYYASYVQEALSSMFPVAKGTTVSIMYRGTGFPSTTKNNPKIRYIPYKQASSSQKNFSQPYLNYSTKTTVEWTSPSVNNGLICEYVATADGVLALDLALSTSSVSCVVKYYINDDDTNMFITKRKTSDSYLGNSIILSKGDKVSVYDTGNAATYSYVGNIKFIPFVTTTSIYNTVSPIPDYANAQTLDITDMPSTFNAGYLFNCRTASTSNKVCTIQLTNLESDVITLESQTHSSNNESISALFPLNGTETFVTIDDNCTDGSVYFIPYTSSVIKPLLVSDVQVNGTSVVDSHGVANITGGGGSTVTVTPIQTTGTKIAEIDVDGVTSDLYAPNGGGGGSTVSVTQKVSSGENIASITVDGVATELYATNTTYSDFSGATAQSSGTHGLVPAPTTSDVDKYLKSDGTWATVSSGGGSSAEELTLIEYDALTPTQKNDGTIRFIPKSTNYLIDSSNVTVLNQGTNMTITATENSVNSSWNNISSNIGCTYYFAIDLTNYNSIIYTLNTGTAFSTTASNAMYVGIADAIPTTYNYNPGLYEVYNSETTTNLLNESRSLDVTNLSGVHYFIAKVSGWNSTINNIQGVPNDNPTQIKYMSKTYAIGEFTGATESADGVGGGVPTPIAGDNKKYLRGDGVWNVVSDSMTLFEYNALTVEERNDGAVRFITNGSDISIDITNVTYYVKASMSVTPLHSDPTKVVTTWNGTSSNRNCVYFIPMNLTGAETIKYKVNTGTSYATTNENRLFVGIATNAPTAASWSSSNYTISNVEDTNNMSATSRTLDVSELSGLYYLVVKADGWNSTVSDVQVTPESVLPQIKYMSETYALTEDMTGATASVDGANGLVPAPSAGDNTKYLKGDGTWGTPDSGSDVSVTQIQSTGTKIATVTVDNVDTDLYAPNGGGGGASDLDDLDDVEITNPTNGQVLKYNSVTQKWENGTGGGGNANMTELTQGEYNALTPAEKENGTMYLTHDGGYDFINYNDGEIIVRVNNNTDETLWFFNGYSKGTAEDVSVPSELTEYIPEWVRTVPDTYMQAKSWSDDTSTTQNGWVGFVNVAGTPMIRGWSVDFTTKVNISSWAVLDANGDHTQGGQTANYSDPYEGISITPNRIYLNGRKYAEVSDGSGGKYERTPLYLTPITTAGEVTLDDEITNYDDIEFIVSGNGTMGVFRCNTTEFINSFPNVASPTVSTPHFLLSPYVSMYCRSIMGTDNNKINIYDISSVDIEGIYGIKYGSGGSGGEDKDTKIGLKQLLRSGQRNYSVGASTYTADRSMTVLAINQNINGESNNQTLTSSITCDGTLIDENIQTSEYLAPNRNHNTYIAFYSLDAGDTITLSNTYTGSYTNQIHLLYEVKNIDTSSIDIVLHELKLQSDNELGFSKIYSILNEGIYVAVGVETSGAGLTDMEATIMESGADESAFDNGILMGTVSAKVGIISGENIDVGFKWANYTSYVTRGYIIYKIV